MNLTIGQLIRHKRSDAVYEFLGKGLSRTQGDWHVFAFYRAQQSGQLYSRPVEEFDQAFEEVK
jgi:hypothetical protein